MMKLTVQVKAIEPTLEAGAQIQQLITAECVEDYCGNFNQTFFFNFLLYFQISLFQTPHQSKYPSDIMAHRIKFH